MPGGHFGGFFGVLLLVVVIYAIIRIAQSNAEPIWKAVWIAGVILVPVLGLILWVLFGPK
ncbi:PLD nuclease N-terminal domain-containing protein [Parvibaculum sp.]|jgi:uncharacterized membrane protein|uniref:PLD nuclease N-terminal domain-containing protein n=1 Tax=Parvibaculum sp. TaxID=2024848 RepID=UPI0034927DF6